jgi:mRNA interferase RelE/StbE
MKYRVVFTKKADRQLLKLDMMIQRLIVAYINKHLEGCEDPRAVGKGLTGEHARKWRYRVGDYRILAQIDDKEIIIYVLKIGHRRDAYKN